MQSQLSEKIEQSLVENTDIVQSKLNITSDALKFIDETQQNDLLVAAIN